MLMVVMLLGTPFFLVSVDTVLSVLITAITGNAKTQLTQQEIGYLKTSIIGNSYNDSNALFGQIFASLSFVPNGYTPSTQYPLIEYLLEIKSDIEQSMSLSQDASYKNACSIEINKISNFISYFGTVSPLNIFSPTDDSQFRVIYNSLSGDLNHLVPGYISGADSNEISYYASQLQMIESTFRSIISNANDINNNFKIDDSF
jgi:hypothetical protein